MAVQADINSIARVIRVYQRHHRKTTMQVQSMSVQGSQLMASTLQGTFARVFELHRDKLAFGVRVCMLSRVVGAVGHTPLRRCRVATYRFALNYLTAGLAPTFSGRRTARLRRV